MLTEEVVRLAAQELYRAISEKRAGLSPESLNTFRHTEAHRRVVRGLLGQWLRDGLLGSAATLSDLEPLTALLVGMGPLDPLIADPSVVSIQVIGPNEVLVLRGGVWEKTDVGWSSAAELRTFALALAARAGQPLEAERPVAQVHFTNPAGRLQIDGTARTPAGVTLHIRLGRKNPITLAQMLADGGMSEEMYDFFSEIALRDVGVLITGQPGTGKTTFLEAWMDFWPALPCIGLDDRSEFYPRHPLCTVYDVPAERLRGALVDALRKNVTRMAVAEVRGDEAAEMLRYSGAMTIWTTLHGSVRNAVLRLAALAQGAPDSPYAALSQEMVQRVIAQAFPVVVETDRLIVGGRPVFFVAEVCVLDEADGSPSPVFQAKTDGPRLEGFTRIGDLRSVLSKYRRRIWGGVELPRLDTLAGLAESDTGAALAALGEYLRIHRSHEGTLALLKRLIDQSEPVRRLVQDGLASYREQAAECVRRRDWTGLLKVYSVLDSDPVALAVAAEVARLESELRPVPPSEAARRAALVEAAQEVLATGNDARHILALIGLLERVRAEADIYPQGMEQDILRRLTDIDEGSAAHVPLHLRGFLKGGTG